MTDATIEEAATSASAYDAPGDDSPYLLHSHLDIVAVLRDIARARTFVSVNFGTGHDSLLTPLLAIDGDAGNIVFDCSGSERLNHGLLRANRLLFYTSQDKVTIRFATAAARLTKHDRRDAFAAPMPATMLRLQRRECYRAREPVTRPVQCVVPVDEPGGPRYVETRLHDIGQGGVSFIVPPDDFPASAGIRYPNCRIVLPESGNAVVTLETVYTLDVTLLNGKPMTRIGCKFVRPSMTALSLIQRHLMKLERERRARE